jgi:hypothetical protein
VPSRLVTCGFGSIAIQPLSCVCRPYKIEQRVRCYDRLYSGPVSKIYSHSNPISSDHFCSNQTIPECDPDLFGMVVSYDMYWWEQDNITDLCLGNCSTAAALWYNNVMSACDGQWLNSFGKWIPADSVAGRYVDGINTACLSSS